jgi:dipeptidyl aminopeptidase/acylaminoacyl peptidase
MLFGGSAGGHLAMLAGLKTSKKNPEIGIKGIINYCGIMDCEAQYEHDLKKKKSMCIKFLNCTPSENRELYRTASPIMHVHKDAPPLWICHGNKDECVPVDQSRALIEKFKNESCEYEYYELEGAPHAMAKEINTDGETRFVLHHLDELIAFINRKI